LVGDHLAASVEPDERSVVAPRVLLELAPVAAARQPFDARPAADTRHAAATAELDVIASCETELAGELFLVKPPGRVHVAAARAVLVVRRQILEERDLPIDAAAAGI